MGVDHYLTRGGIIILIGIWVGSALLAFVSASFIGLSTIQITGILGVIGTFGILTVQIIRVVNPGAGEQSIVTDSQEGGAEEGSGTEDADVETSEPESTTSSDESATAGLSPTDRQVQNLLIKKAYQDFTDGPFKMLLPRNQAPYVDELVDAVDGADEETVQRVWRFSKDDRFFERRAGSKSLQLTPKAVWRAEALGEEVLVDDAVQDEILDVLLAAYRENPGYARVARDDLIDAVGLPDAEVDHNVWWLEEKGFVEVEQYSGPGDAGYDYVEITELGRQVIQ